MFDTLFDSVRKIIKSRLFPIFIIYFLLFSTLIYRVFTLQIVKGEAIEAESEKSMEQIRDIKSTRGNFRDRNGKLLAYNELSYSVTLQDNGELTDNAEKNAMIYKMIGIIEENGGSLDYEFGIIMDKKQKLSFRLEGSALQRFKKDVYGLNPSDSLDEEQAAATAEDVFSYLRKEEGKKSGRPNNFDIDDSYTKEEALKIMSVRYTQYMNRFTKYVAVTLALDVNEATVAAIEENRADLPGVDILQETHRVYNDSEYFASIMGYTGLVNSETIEQFENEEDKNYYNLTDQIGKTGLEKKYENYLRGEKGSETLMVNESTRVIAVKERTEPKAGNDVYLTLDANLQKACYTILEKQIAGILLSKINNGTDVGTKGSSADGILIPIYDVYFALIDNNVIDINSFNNEDATELEQKVYQKYVTKREHVFAQLDRLLAHNSKVTNKKASEEMADYLNYIYSMLSSSENKVLLTELIDVRDPVYVGYKNEEISLSEFLQHALSKSWIDLSKLSIGEEYYSMEELYGKLFEYTKTLLEADSKFNKKLYHYLVYSYKLSGKEICLLLFDQGVLEYDEGEIEKLETNKINAYDFIKQKIKELKITPGQLALEPCSGSVIVTEEETGEVLACVTYPSYDNNKLANTIDSAYFAKLSEDKSYPMHNRPTRESMAPGSTFKMVSAATLLEEHVVTPEETIKDKHSFEEIFNAPRCWKSTSHGDVNISHAIGVSCNYYFYDAAYRMSLDKNGVYNDKQGLAKLKKYADMFGLDAPSGIELYEETPKFSDSDSVRSAIGQGTHSFTPVQISRYLTTLANRGTCYNLTIIDKITDLNGNVIEDNSATVYNKVKLAPSTWTNILNGMYEVVNGPDSSISSLFKNLDVPIAGKTGTAQMSKSNPNHGLFVSFAPYENPEITVTVVIPNGYTSSNAAEVARDIYRYYFKKNERKKLLAEKVSWPELNTGYSD